MGTLSEASFRAASGRKYPCQIATILRQLAPPDRKVLEKVLTERRPENPELWAVSERAIARILTEAGYPIKESAVGTHRGHECRG